MVKAIEVQKRALVYNTLTLLVLLKALSVISSMVNAVDKPTYATLCIKTFLRFPSMQNFKASSKNLYPCKSFVLQWLVALGLRKQSVHNIY
jgi:hypothetical protein